VKGERIERSQLWRHGPALRFTCPGGHIIELDDRFHETDQLEPFRSRR
jgi:hypothetical protein